MRENAYQAMLIRRLKRQYPNALILKNDPTYLQGIPDLLILEGDRWAMLEVKASEFSPSQPNQDYYVRLADGLSFAAFVYPANEEEVLDELHQALHPRRDACFPECFRSLVG